MTLCVVCDVLMGGDWPVPVCGVACAATHSANLEVEEAAELLKQDSGLSTPSCSSLVGSDYGFHFVSESVVQVSIGGEAELVRWDGSASTMVCK